MKNFADWTQDLAESIGPVEHHWETRKEAELRGIVTQEFCEEFGGAIAPNWQNPGAPISGGGAAPSHNPQPAMQVSVKYDFCEWCGLKGYLFVPPSDPNGPCICKTCLDQVYKP